MIKNVVRAQYLQNNMTSSYLLYVVGLFMAIKVKNLANVGFFFPPFKFLTMILK